MSKTPKPKRGAWFVKVRGSYLPCSWQGWLLYVPFILFLILALVVAINAGVSFAEVFFRVFPVWIAAVVVLTWIASNHS